MAPLPELTEAPHTENGAFVRSVMVIFLTDSSRLQSYNDTKQYIEVHDDNASMAIVSPFIVSFRLNLYKRKQKK